MENDLIDLMGGNKQGGAKICGMASQLDTGSPTDLRGITAQQKRGKVPS